MLIDPKYSLNRHMYKYLSEIMIEHNLCNQTCFGDLLNEYRRATCDEFEQYIVTFPMATITDSQKLIDEVHKHNIGDSFQFNDYTVTVNSISDLTKPILYIKDNHIEIQYETGKDFLYSILYSLKYITYDNIHKLYNPKRRNFI